MNRDSTVSTSADCLHSRSCDEFKGTNGLPVPGIIALFLRVSGSRPIITCTTCVCAYVLDEDEQGHTGSGYVMFEDLAL